MPEGESWTLSNDADGSFFIATVDNEGAKVSVATYISSSADPLKVVTIPLDLKKGKKVNSIMTVPGGKQFINYLAVVYENTAKDITLLTSKIDFKDGSSKVTKEVFDSKHTKELKKSFIPVNKKFDDLQFTKLEFLGVKHMEEFGDKLLVGVSPSFRQSSNNAVVNFDGSLLMNIHDQDLKRLYHQFIPRTYMSLHGEGSNIAYSLKDNTLRMIANMRPGGVNSVYSLYGEMDFTTGKMLKTTKLPDKDIKSGLYVSTESVTWLDNSFILPYFDRLRILRTTIDVQMQLLNY